MPPPAIALEECFGAGGPGETVLRLAGVHRRRRRAGGVEILEDAFPGAGAACAFLRIEPGAARTVELTLAGAHRLESCPLGGWLLVPASRAAPCYWIPQAPAGRTLDRFGRIEGERGVTASAFEAGERGLRAAFRADEGEAFDLAAWQLRRGHLRELADATLLERQRYFVWAGHTRFERLADLYRHLVFGTLYNDHFAWPHRRKIPDELDAYALYLVLSGLERATGKRLYALCKTQVALSVAARLAPDGGWYHGEWTERMESHLRLHAGGVQLLCQHVEETSDSAAREALARSAQFLAAKRDRLDTGVWFLHDTLEEDEASLRDYPFAYAPSRAFGKSPANLLVLNTHVDTLVALSRYREVTGDEGLDELLASGLRALAAVLEARPAEWLYRPLFRLAGLTFRPASRAASLPVRAARRLARERLVPNLHRVKARFPRLVMPGGYIDRGLGQKALAHAYQSVNVLDLVRLRRRHPESVPGELLEQACAFTRRSGLLELWGEQPAKRHALGFWAEALYHLCLDTGKPHHAGWLAEAVLAVEDAGVGLPPSLLGANAAALAPQARAPCPEPPDDSVRIVNLGSASGRQEFLAINAGRSPVACPWPPGEAAGPAATEEGEEALLEPRGWRRFSLAAAPAEPAREVSSG